MEKETTHLMLKNKYIGRHSMPRHHSLDKGVTHTSVTSFFFNVIQSPEKHGRTTNLTAQWLYVHWSNCRLNFVVIHRKILGTLHTMTHCTTSLYP